MVHYWKKTDTQIIYWQSWIFKDLIVIECLGVVEKGEEYQEIEFSTKESAENYLAAQIEEIKKEGFIECLFEHLDVLFVQLYSVGLNIPKHAISTMELMDLRHKTEQIIENALKKEGLGEWFAGDLGQGGANMLFTVYELEKSFNVIKEVLQENNLLDKTLIAKRIDITPDDWNHEIIYPANYDGEFYSG